MVRERACFCDEAAGHQLPTAAAFWVIRIVSTEDCLHLMQNWMQIHYSTRSVILNVMATQYTCSLNSIYRPLLTNTVNSSLFMDAHSSPLSLAARLHRHWADHSVILTTAGLFLDRSRHIQIQVWCRLEVVLLHKEPNSFPGNKGLWEIHRFQRTFSCYKSLKC